MPWEVAQLAGSRYRGYLTLVSQHQAARPEEPGAGMSVYDGDHVGRTNDGATHQLVRPGAGNADAVHEIGCIFIFRPRHALRRMNGDGQGAHIPLADGETISVLDVLEAVDDGPCPRLADR